MMRTKLAQLAPLALLALIVGCGGSGSSTTPLAAGGNAPTSTGTATKGSAPNASATLPPGTVGITLTIKIPPSKLNAAVHARLAAKRRAPQFIQSQTDGVSVLVTANGQSNTVTGSCTTSTCTVIVPIPIAYASTIVASLTEGGTPIGQATHSFAANFVAEGTTGTGVTLTFQPLIGTITVDGGNMSFLQGQPNASFSVLLHLYDAYGNEILSDPDGVLDTNGVAFSNVVLSAYGGVTMPGAVTSLTVPVTSIGSTAIAISPNAWDGSTNPDIVPSVSGNTISNYYDLASTSSYTAHGFAVTLPAAWNGSSSIEYPYPAAAPSPGNPVNNGQDTFTMSESIPSDEIYATVFEDVQNGAYNSNSSCTSIASFPGSTPSGPYSYTELMFSGGYVNYSINYLTGAFNGVCTLEFADGANVLGGVWGYQDVTISVNNPTVIISGKKRK